MPRETSGQDSIQDLAAQLISVTEASEFSGLTTSFIRRLLREQRIKGVKVGRNWLTTKEALQDYLKQDRRPGPKPRR